MVRTLEQNEHGNIRTPRTVFTGLGWSFRGKQPERVVVCVSEGVWRVDDRIEVEVEVNAKP